MQMGEIIESTSIETLIEQIQARFDDIAEISVHHTPNASQPSFYYIKVITGSAKSFEQYVDITAADEIVIDVDGSKSLAAPFEVMASFMGPGTLQNARATTIYMGENGLGAESRELDVGLSILRKKSAGYCPICGENTEKLGDHYRENQDCRKAEQV